MKQEKVQKESKKPTESEDAAKKEPGKLKQEHLRKVLMAFQNFNLKGLIQTLSIIAK